MTPRTRFAPSPSGPLHLGHAYAAQVAWERAKAGGGEALLRIEDIDPERSKPQWETAIYADLEWLGFTWPEPVMRQSTRAAAYDKALQTLGNMGLLYPCSCTRGDIRAALSAPQEGTPLTGPDGLIYPGTCRLRALASAQPGEALRLNMAAACAALPALPRFVETGPRHAATYAPRSAQMVTEIGDVVLCRRGWGTSYHLSVVVDDAEQAITEVTRGEDLFEATPLHALLFALLGHPIPNFHHHALVRDTAGKRLAKRDDARALSTLRAEGLTPAQVLDRAAPSLSSC